MAKTVIALYDDISTARDVVHDLVDRGIDRADISLIASDRDREYSRYIGAEPDGRDEDAGASAGAGAVIGGLEGLLIGLGALAIPGVGPLIAAGPIAAALLGAGSGAVTGGLLGGLLGADIPDGEAGEYAEYIRRGGALVAVEAPEERVEAVEEAMLHHNPVDLERRTEYWRESGWTGYDRQATPYTPEDYQRERQYWTQAGADDVDYTVRTYGDYWDYEDYAEDFRDHYQVTYLAGGYAFDRYEPAYRYGYDLATLARYRDRDWDEIESEARSNWERRGQGVWEDFKAAVRHAWDQARAGFDDDYDESFRRHYQTTYASTGNDYDVYEPAYSYGYDLAAESRYRTRDWDAIEPEARQRWESEQGSTWEDFKDAVRHAWNEVKSAFEADYDEYAEDFRQHSQTHYGNGDRYLHYEPAYRYGYDLAWAYHDQDWDAVESEARQRWERENQGPWEDVKAAVRYAWSEVKDALDEDEEDSADYRRN